MIEGALVRELLPVEGDEGEEVRRRRERLGLSIKQLAADSGVSRDTISDLESGMKDTRRSTLAKVVRVLEQFELEAFGVTGEEVPPPPKAPEVVTVEFEVDGRVVRVTAPAGDPEALQRHVAAVVRGLRDNGDEG